MAVCGFLPAQPPLEYARIDSKQPLWPWRFPSPDLNLSVIARGGVVREFAFETFGRAVVTSRRHLAMAASAWRRGYRRPHARLNERKQSAAHS